MVLLLRRISIAISNPRKLKDARIALNPLLKSFLQLGHTRATDPSEAFSSVKWTSTRALSEYACRFVSDEAGHMGVNLISLLAMISLMSVPGVSDGTQKEGNADLLDSDCSSPSA